MCVTFCHKLNLLYWDHEDCHPAQCPFAGEPQDACVTCRHKDGQVCRSTNAALPLVGGCCHHNVSLVRGPQPVTVAMITLLEVGSDETLAAALEDRNVRCRPGEAGEIWVDPDDLPLPATYGRGTDHLADEPFDWSGWYEQWESGEVDLSKRGQEN